MYKYVPGQTVWKHSMVVKVTVFEDLLGGANKDPNFHLKHIASGAVDGDKITEEMDALTTAETIKNATTGFSRNAAGIPIIWDYQVRGFFKEAMAAAIEVETQAVMVGSTAMTKWSARRFVDNFLSVSPRQIPLVAVEPVLCARPLRAANYKQDIQAIASSEVVAAGVTFEITIATMSSDLLQFAKAALNYGSHKGLGQWRNSGKGRFIWELISESSIPDVERVKKVKKEKKAE